MNGEANHNCRHHTDATWSGTTWHLTIYETHTTGCYEQIPPHHDCPLCHKPMPPAPQCKCCGEPLSGLTWRIMKDKGEI